MMLRHHGYYDPTVITAAISSINYMSRTDITSLIHTHQTNQSPTSGGAEPLTDNTKSYLSESKCQIGSKQNQQSI